MNFEDAAALIAAVFAVDPHALGGVCLRSSANPLRGEWLQLLRDLLPAEAPLRKIPFNISDSRLLGGLDLVATLRAGTPIAERGVLASIHGGVVAVSMAERLTVHTAKLLCSALEQGEIHSEREGVVMHHASRFGIVALDEGVSDDEFTPHCILDRCAFLLDFASLNARTELIPTHERAQIVAARSMLADVKVDAAYVQALCATAMALGAGSVRVSILAVRAARTLAALDGRLAVTQDDAELAGRLVLAPRASAMPTQNEDAPADASAPPERAKASDPLESPPVPEESPGDAPRETAQETSADLQQMQDSVLAATQSAIPSGLLSQLRAPHGPGKTAGGATAGRFGQLRKGGTRGRPSGVAPASRDRSRLNIIETLRAAAPWQSVRRRVAGNATRMQIQPEDLRVTRYKQRSRTLTIFAVDASGSSALNRLAEAKGAAELLLADCYVRRDQVAVIAFRGRAADIVLPPTRSLVRAKRSLSALPGGGGTPLAAAIDAAALLALQAQRRGESPIVVMLTDGRGNVARDGRMGREVGQADAMSAARIFGAARISALFVDTSPRPHDLARDLARGMRASYVPLPFADARALSKLIGSAGASRPAEFVVSQGRGLVRANAVAY